jgi:hypothetical protein
MSWPLSLGHPHCALCEARSDGLRCEVRIPLPLLCFKISESSNSFAGDIDPNILGGSVGVANERSNSPRIEDPIKITTGGLSCIGELITGRLDLYAGVMGLLQPFCSFVRLFEQHGVTLSSSGALGDQPEENLAGIDGRVAQAPTDELHSNGSFGFSLAELRLHASGRPFRQGSLLPCTACRSA